MPIGLSIVEAAALPETFFTVWSILFDRGGAKAGETALVHGGASGTAPPAIVLGKAFGRSVIVADGSDAKAARAIEIGADHAINYREADFVEEVKRITGGRGVDVVLDMIGGDYVARNIASMAEEGRHVSIAVQRGAKAEIPVWTIMAKRLTLTGSTLRARPVEFKAAIADALRREVWPHLESGRIRPIIDTVLPLEAAADAHLRMESSDHIGKIVLEIG